MANMPQCIMNWLANPRPLINDYANERNLKCPSQDYPSCCSRFITNSMKALCRPEPSRRSSILQACLVLSRCRCVAKTSQHGGRSCAKRH